MTSKNSFWGSMRENLKRRNWIAVINSIVFLLFLPIGVTLWITAENAYKTDASLLDWKEYMIRTANDYFSLSTGITLLVTIVAAVCALQGFSYVFNRRKMDMYMSVPVSKERRFGVIYLNGVLLFVVPYFLCLVVAIAICAANGIMTLEIIKVALYSFLAYLLYYVAVYNVMIVAVMMTGNLLVALCAFGVFTFYELMIKLLYTGLCSMFYQSYAAYGQDYKSIFSPVMQMFAGVEQAESGVYGVAHTVPYLIHQTGMSLLKVLVLAVAYGVIGYMLYRKRPTESCNKSIAFAKTRAVIKVCVMVPVSIMVGVLFYSITNGNLPTMILGLVIGILLSHGVMEIIFEFDLKAAIRHLKSGAVGAVLAFAVFCVFQFDLTGYDKWVPNPKNVESIAISIPNFSNGNGYDIENGYWSGSGYTFKHMEITQVDAVCDLMKKVGAEHINTEEGDDFLWMTVKYRMKNGDDKYREVVIPYKEYMAEMETIITNPEFIEGNYQIFEPSFLKEVKLSSAILSNGVWDVEMDKGDIDSLYEVYAEDFRNLTFDMIANELPIGTIYFEFMPKNGSYGNEILFEMPVYDSFDGVETYLEKYEVTKEWQPVLKHASVITVQKYDELTGMWEDSMYTEPEDIEALIPALVPNNLLFYQLDAEKESGKYDIYVEYSWTAEEEDFSAYRDTLTSYFSVKPSLLPEFAK